MPATDAFAGLYGRLSGVVVRPVERPGGGAPPTPAQAVRPSLLLTRLDALRPKPARRTPTWHLE